MTKLWNIWERSVFWAVACVPARAHTQLYLRRSPPARSGEETLSHRAVAPQVARSRNTSWTAWAWVPGDENNCAYPMLNVGTQLIGHNAWSLGDGIVSGKAACDTDITLVDQSHGANITALWTKYYAQGQ